jgi:lysyl endopeptidase
VNLTFTESQIPEGNELYVFNPTKDFILGKFTQKHLYEGTLGTELVPGNTVIIEYFIPKGNPEGRLYLSTITHGYRTSNEFLVKAFGSSGSCNMNVNCPDGFAWTQARNSALMLVSGSNGFCSGALINTTANDGKPFVITANHCYSNPTNWIFRFNWQAADCNNPSNSPSFQSISGAVLRARRTPSDFCLVEITGGLENNTVPLSFQPFFAGWNRSNVPPTSTVSIHHPAGDIKKIAFDDQAAIAVQAMSSTEPESSWQVIWDRNTTTEGGSSGSPLFDQNRRIIGQLWGGGASCTNLSSPDYYGRLHNSWNPAGSNETNHAQSWLDPSNSGAEFIDGYDPLNAEPIAVDAGITGLQGASGTFCDEPIIPSFLLQNGGAQTLTSATITYTITGQTPQTYNWSGSLAQWQSTTVNLPTINLSGGSYTFTAVVSNPNGSEDENPFNNQVSSAFQVVTNGEIVELLLTLDCYGSETSWELQDENSNAIYFGVGYNDDTQGLLSIPWCLNEGCYRFVIMDSYGDGLDGGFFCPQDGSVAIVYEGFTLAEIPVEEANFGTQRILNFCLGTNQIGESTMPQVRIFPNPAKETITIERGHENFAKISLIDITGRHLQQWDLFAAAQDLTLPEVSAGNYFLILSDGFNHSVHKLVIE